MIKWFLRALYLTLAVAIGAILVWSFYPAKVYDKANNEPVKLLGAFYSFMTPEEVLSGLNEDTSNVGIVSSGLNYDSKFIDYKNIKIGQYEGDIVFSFINGKLVRIRFSPQKFNEFIEYFNNTLEQSSPDQFRKTTISQNEKFVVLSDTRLAEENISHMRRYGSD